MFGFPNHTPEEMREIISGYIKYITIDRPDTLNAIFSPEICVCDPETPLLSICFPIEEHMLNTSGMAHGGVITTAYDITMGTLSRWHQNGRMSPTLTMTVDFIKPVPSGGRLVVEARPIAAAKHTIDYECRAWLEAEPEIIVNKCTGRFFIYESIKNL